MPMTFSVAGERETKLWTSDEFLDRFEDEDIKAELIDGKIVRHLPVDFRHANLLNFFDLLLGLYIDAKNSANFSVS